MSIRWVGDEMYLCRAHKYVIILKCCCDGFKKLLGVCGNLTHMQFVLLVLMGSTCIILHDDVCVCAHMWCLEVVAWIDWISLSQLNSLYDLCLTVDF